MFQDSLVLTFSLLVRCCDTQITTSALDTLIQDFKRGSSVFFFFFFFFFLSGIMTIEACVSKAVFKPWLPDLVELFLAWGAIRCIYKARFDNISITTGRCNQYSTFGRSNSFFYRVKCKLTALQKKRSNWMAEKMRGCEILKRFSCLRPPASFLAVSLAGFWFSGLLELKR